MTLRTRELARRVTRLERGTRQAKADQARREAIALRIARENNPHLQALKLINAAAAGAESSYNRLLLCLVVAGRFGADLSFTGGREPKAFIDYHLRGLVNGVEITDEHLALIQVVGQQLADSAEDDDDDYWDDDDDYD